MIRVQQDQISALQSPVSDTQHSPSMPQSQADTARGEPSLSGSSIHAAPPSPLQRPANLSRHSSRGLSIASSPSLRPGSSGHGHDEWLSGTSRDEGAFYQAESHMLQRENQMLKHRIRELGKSSSPAKTGSPCLILLAERQLGDVASPT